MRLFTSSLTVTPRRRVALTVALAAGLAVAIGSGAMAANAATPSLAAHSQVHHTVASHAASSPTAASRAAARFERVIRASEARCAADNAVTAQAGKAALISDRAAARALAAGSTRTAAFAAIHAKAIAGGYGSAVQSHAQIVAGRTDLHLGKLPAALVADLKAVHTAAPADRLALETAIANKAVAGSYGATVEAAAVKIEAAGCPTAK